LKAVSALCLSLFLFTLGATRAGASPSQVYSTLLSGFVSDVAVDSAGNAYALFMEGPSHSYFVAKLSPSGELIFQRPLELPPREPSDPPREPSSIAIDPAGSIYIAGLANYGYQCCDEGTEVANVGFVAKLGPDGTGLFYDTYFWDGVNTQTQDLAVDALGRAYVRSTSRWPDKYGIPISDAIRFSPAGSIQTYWGYSSYLWSYGPTAMALGPSGDLFTVGSGLQLEDYDNPYTAAYLQRTDASSGAVVETVLPDSGTIDSPDVAGAPGGGSVVVGMKGEGLYVGEFSPAGEEIFSRILNLGAVGILDVVVTSSGEIILGVRTGSGTIVLRLEGGTGEVISSISFTDASAVAVGPGGDVYLALGGRVARFSENRPPDCSGATASPSVIWPPNGRMIPVSILGVTEPEGGAVAVRVSGITQDEPGAAFSGIGSPVAQVKAERDGTGDGRVYRIQFEAADPSGASCTGEVTVCVPHDQGQEELRGQPWDKVKYRPSRVRRLAPAKFSPRAHGPRRTSRPR